MRKIILLVIFAVVLIGAIYSWTKSKEAHTNREGVIKCLVNQLEDKDADSRRVAVRVLSEMNAKESIAGLIRLLKDEDYHVREEAINTLVKFNANESILQFRELLKDKSKNQSYILVIEALIKLDAKPPIPELIPLLKDRNWRIYKLTIDAIVKLGCKEAIPSLVELLQDKNQRRDNLSVDMLYIASVENVRGLAAIALVELGAKDKIKAKNIKDIRSFLERQWRSATEYTWPYSPDLYPRARKALKELGEDVK